MTSSEFATSRDKSFSNDELLDTPVSMSADRVEIYEDINVSETLDMIPSPNGIGRPIA